VLSLFPLFEIRRRCREDLAWLEELGSSEVQVQATWGLEQRRTTGEWGEAVVFYQGNGCLRRR